MKLKVLQLLIVVLLAFTVSMFYQVFDSSVRLERSKASFDYLEPSDIKNIENIVNLLAKEGGFDGVNNIALYGAELEVTLRYLLLMGVDDYKGSSIVDIYTRLLSIKPSWPYLMSGRAQSREELDTVVEKSVLKAIEYGQYERRVAYSVAEIFFYNWNKLESGFKKDVFEYLSKQPNIVKERIARIALRFAKMYEYCDYIFERDGTKVRFCQSNYWSPLLG